MSGGWISAAQMLPLPQFHSFCRLGADLEEHVHHQQDEKDHSIDQGRDQAVLVARMDGFLLQDHRLDFEAGWAAVRGHSSCRLA